MALQKRQYDIVVYGATGYTGQYCTEHITTRLPTNISWAVAGRSHQKLVAAAQALKNLNPDRKQPDVEVAQLNNDDLHSLVRKTRILINCAGPYMFYGEPVLKACASEGTHYLDVCGESPWVLEMINKYHDIAKRNKAIIIPQIGVESAPTDTLVYAVAKILREKLSLPTKEVIVAIHEMKAAPSGGTLSSLLGGFSKYSLAQMVSATRPAAMCTIPISKNVSTPSLLTRISGVRIVPDLGTLTTSLQGPPDVPIVHRSWGLLTSLDSQESYGPNFTFHPYMSVRNTFVGVLVHIAVTLLPLLLAFPPVQWIVKKVVYEPGQGPSKDETKNDVIEYRALGIPDADTRQKAFARLRFDGSLYEVSGLFLAEAAATLLQDEKTYAKKLGGGVLTPATLGQGFIDRFSKAGVIFETKILEY